MIGPGGALVGTMKSTDPLDNEVIWHGLILDFVSLPMNNGTNVGGVPSLALAAGIDPHRAVAKTLTYYHHDASRTPQ